MAISGLRCLVVVMLVGLTFYLGLWWLVAWVWVALQVLLCGLVRCVVWVVDASALRV